MGNSQTSTSFYGSLSPYPRAYPKRNLPHHYIDSKRQSDTYLVRSVLAATMWDQLRRLRKETKLRILIFAGREASAAFQIACPKNSVERGIAEEALLYEPFTYWDWQEGDANIRTLHNDGGYGQADLEVDDGKRKRRLLWERERGFAANGEWIEYPGPKRRWLLFQKRIKNGNRGFVKRIAVAWWMTVKDLEW